MFQGVDPDGLNGLATTIEFKTASLRRHSRIVLDILSRKERSTELAQISAAVARAEDWGNDTATTIRWRADAITSGQRARFNVPALIQAGFAANAVFSATTIDEEYRAWVAEWQASSRRVDEAAAQISVWLDQGWTDWDVTNDDLHNIWSTLDGLSGSELDGVITALTPRQLARWLDEMGHSVNGFSREERQQVFTMLATNGSGESLGRISEAILAGASPDQDAVDLGVAIRRHSPDRTIIDFVAFVVAQDLTGHRYSGVAPALAMAGIEDTTAIDKAMRTILTSDDALEVIVIDSLVSARVEDTGAACIDLNPLASLAAAMGRGADVEVKTLGFAALVGLAGRSGSQIAELMQARHSQDGSQKDSSRDSRAASADIELVSAATRLLISDANAVIQDLATTIDIDGSVTSAYLYQLIDHDQFHNLSRVVNALRGGDEVDVVQFSNVGADPSYPHPHAQNLAFVAATLNIALERYAAGALADIQNITLVADVAKLVAGTIYALELKAAEIAASVFEFSVGKFALDTQVSDIVNDINTQLDQVTGTVSSRLKPQKPLEVEPDHLGSAFMTWTERYDLVHTHGSSP